MRTTPQHQIQVSGENHVRQAADSKQGCQKLQRLSNPHPAAFKRLNGQQIFPAQKSLPHTPLDCIHDLHPPRGRLR